MRRCLSTSRYSHCDYRNCFKRTSIFCMYCVTGHRSYIRYTLTAGGHTDMIAAFGCEGSQFESSQHWSTSQFGSRLLRGLPSWKIMCIFVSLVKEAESLKNRMIIDQWKTINSKTAELWIRLNLTISSWFGYRRLRKIHVQTKKNPYTRANKKGAQ